MKAFYTLLFLFVFTINNSIAQKNSPLELGSIIPMSKKLMIDVSDETMSLNNNFNKSILNQS